MIHLLNAVIRTTNIVDAKKTMTMISPADITILIIMTIPKNYVNGKKKRSCT